MTMMLSLGCCAQLTPCSLYLALRGAVAPTFSLSAKARAPSTLKNHVRPCAGMTLLYAACTHGWADDIDRRVAALD